MYNKEIPDFDPNAPFENAPEGTYEKGSNMTPSIPYHKHRALICRLNFKSVHKSYDENLIAKQCMSKVVENITLDFRPYSKEDDAYKVMKKYYRCKEDKDLNCFTCFFTANKNSVIQTRI